MEKERHAPNSPWEMPVLYIMRPRQCLGFCPSSSKTSWKHWPSPKGNRGLIPISVETYSTYTLNEEQTCTFIYKYTRLSLHEYKRMNWQSVVKRWTGKCGPRQMSGESVHTRMLKYKYYTATSTCHYYDRQHNIHHVIAACTESHCLVLCWQTLATCTHFMAACTTYRSPHCWHAWHVCVVCMPKPHVQDVCVCGNHMHCLYMHRMCDSHIVYWTTHTCLCIERKPNSWLPF